MRSEIDVEIVKIRGIIYQQNLGMDFESRGNVWIAKTTSKAELLQLNQTQFPFLGIFFNKKVGFQKN